MPISHQLHGAGVIAFAVVTLQVVKRLANQSALSATATRGEPGMDFVREGAQADAVATAQRNVGQQQRGIDCMIQFGNAVFLGVHQSAAVDQDQNGLIAFGPFLSDDELTPAGARLPIQFALAYPDRLKSDFPRFDFARYPSLTFEKPDTETFRNLALAFEVLVRGGNMSCVLNAANEVAVEEFLNERIGFLEMSEVVEQCLAKSDYIREPRLEDYVETDKITRIRAKELIK